MTDFFPGFSRERIKVDDVTIHARVGGAGPPLLLLHGAPQSHVMWRRTAPALAQRFTVVASDLRGYGESDKPAGGGDHAAYAKRQMAADQHGLMRALGFERFCLAGHDRGARTARRLAKDHRAAVERLAILDIVPTAWIYKNVTREVAANLWHWFFFSQPEPIPEILMGDKAARFAAGSVRAAPDEEAARAYGETNGAPQAWHAMCEDYRAGASIDLIHDAADADHPIECPTLVAWGRASPSTGALFDVPAAWAHEAGDLSFLSFDCGHFLPEERPAETVEALTSFFAA